MNINSAGIVVCQKNVAIVPTKSGVRLQRLGVGKAHLAEICLAQCKVTG